MPFSDMWLKSDNTDFFSWQFWVYISQFSLSYSEFFAYISQFWRFLWILSLLLTIPTCSLNSVYILQFWLLSLNSEITSFFTSHTFTSITFSLRLQTTILCLLVFFIQIQLFFCVCMRSGQVSKRSGENSHNCEMETRCSEKQSLNYKENIFS